MSASAWLILALFILFIVGQVFDLVVTLIMLFRTSPRRKVTEEAPPAEPRPLSSEEQIVEAYWQRPENIGRKRPDRS